MQKNVLKEMIQTQYDLNTGISGEGWVFGQTKDGKLINWPRTVMLETAELIESYPWKHWKNINGSVDLANVKIELSDMWHFILSYQIHIEFINTLARRYDTLLKESEGKSLRNVIKKDDYEDLLLFIKDFNSESSYCSVSTSEFFKNEILNNVVEFFYKQIHGKTVVPDELKEKMRIKKQNINYQLHMFEKIIKESSAASCHESIDFAYPSLSKSIMQKHSHNIRICDFFFFVLKEVVVFDLEKVYFGKSILNKFRQENGYKEGTYVKNWGPDKIEDNVFMLKALESTSLERLPGVLLSKYKELN